MKISQDLFINKLKNVSKRNIFFKKIIDMLASFFRLLNLIFSLTYNIYKSFTLNLKNKKQIKLAFIGPIHSPHFKNFKSTFDKNFLVQEEKSSMYINSYVSEISKDFSMELIIDKGIYNLFGYLSDSMKSKNWTQNILLDAKHNLNNLNKKFIFNRLKNFKPDILWIHDLQSGGYLANYFIQDLKKILPQMKVVVSIWGNDLYFFYEHPLHRSQIKKLLINADYLHGESPRDGLIAQTLGFKGCILPECSITMTNNEDFENLFKRNSSFIKKDIFLCIKGSYYLRSNLSYFFDEINSNPSFWIDKKIVVVGSSKEDIFFIQKVNKKNNLNIEYFSWMTFDEYLDILGRSKFHLVCNLSDGILNSAAEASFLNCLPIFSNHTGLCDFLPKELAENITYDFLTVSFENIFFKLDSDQGKYDYYLDQIREIYRSKVYNEETYKDVFKQIRL